MHSILRYFSPLWTISSLLLAALVSMGLFASPIFAQDLDYNRDIRPILAEYCFACHGFDNAKREAGLRLDTQEGATEMLDSGFRAIVPRDTSKSELLRRVHSTEESEVMPPAESGKHLSQQQKEKLSRWIEQGATYSKHWAFIKPKKHPIPSLLHPSNEVNEIDFFVRSRLEKEGLPHSQEADPITLLRRIYLDITGLPPTPKEVDEFRQEHSRDPDRAYEKWVVHLLESKHYGERWGRWWLDQARYADSNGYSVDAPRQIWRYRDWVIDAMNRDQPFDQFTIEQLAGDLLPNATEEQKIATGFHRNTQINQEGGIDPEQFRIDSIFDRVATTGSVWLGLSIGCAQCHNHKFDPIEQKEYYQLFAFFNNQDEPTLKFYPPEMNAKELSEEQKSLEKEQGQTLAQKEEAIAAWEKELSEEAKGSLSKEVQKTLGVERSKRTVAQKSQLYLAGIGMKDEDFGTKQERLKKIDSLLDKAPTTLVMKERAEPRKTTLFIQGDFTRPSEEVTSGTPAVLHPFPDNKGSKNRLDFAKWLVQPENPLTARVIVNRVWQQYFGRGIVETENDFGLQGAAPTHAELMDQLAIDFIESGWSLKSLHKKILMSRTYRQRSIDRKDLIEKDPNNYLLARQRRMRLEAEIVRDVGLAASGLLSRKSGGPPVYPPIPDGVMTQGQVKRDWKVSEGEDRYRRGLYTFIYRATPPPSLNVFDAPDGFSSCTRRIRSNTPLQALTLLNDAAYFEFATALQKRIESEGIESAFRSCTSRHPEPDELEALRRLDTLSAARVMLNLDETVTRE